MKDVNVSELPSKPDDNVRARIFLRNEPFTLRCNILKATTEDARAALIGVDYRTLYTARRGGAVGEKFIAGTISALERHATRFAEMNVPITFEALFETIDAGAAVTAGIAS